MNITKLDRTLFCNIPGDKASRRGEIHLNPSLPRNAYKNFDSYVAETTYNRKKKGESTEDKDVHPDTGTFIKLVDHNLVDHFVRNAIFYQRPEEGIAKFPAGVAEGVKYFDEVSGEMKQDPEYFELLSRRYVDCGSDVKNLGGSFAKHLQKVRFAVMDHEEAKNKWAIFKFLLRLILPVIGAVLWYLAITVGLNAGKNAADEFFAVMAGIGITLVSWGAMIILPVPVLMGFGYAIKALFPQKVDPDSLRRAFLRAMHYVRFRVLWYQTVYGTDEVPRVLKDMEEAVYREVGPFYKKMKLENMTYEQAVSYLFEESMLEEF